MVGCKVSQEIHPKPSIKNSAVAVWQAWNTPFKQKWDLARKREKELGRLIEKIDWYDNKGMVDTNMDRANWMGSGVILDMANKLKNNSQLNRFIIAH